MIPEKPIICCICNKPIEIKGTWRWGNNADPIADGRCCDHCDQTVVIPARVVSIYKQGLRR